MAMPVEGGGTLSEIYQSAKKGLLKVRDGVEKLERLESLTLSGGYDSPELSFAVKKDIAQIQLLCVEMDHLWRSVTAKSQRDQWRRKVEQVAEEADSLKKRLDKYFLRNQRRMNEARERVELLGRANGESAHVLRIFDEEAQAMQSIRNSSRMLQESFATGTASLAKYAEQRERLKFSHLHMASSSNVFHKLLESNLLTGQNYKDWMRHLRYLLESEHIGYVLEAPMPMAVEDNASQEDWDAFDRWQSDNRRVRLYMLATMSRELSDRYETMDSAYEILQSVQQLYGENSRVAEYDMCVTLFNMKLMEGIAPDDHVIRMINIIGQLRARGTRMPPNLEVNLILQSLPSSFKGLITNYNLNKLERSLPDLLNDIQEYHKQMSKEKGHTDIHMVTASRTDKLPKCTPQGPKGPKKKIVKNKAPVPQKFKVKQPKGKCFHCEKDGHWKRNCPEYLDSLKKVKTGFAE